MDGPGAGSKLFFDPDRGGEFAAVDPPGSKGSSVCMESGSQDPEAGARQFPLEHSRVEKVHHRGKSRRGTYLEMQEATSSIKPGHSSPEARRCS
jgi:hypothetical protein